MGNIFDLALEAVDAWTYAAAKEAQMKAQQEAMIVSTIIGVIVIIIIIAIISKRNSKFKNMKKQFSELKLGMTKDKVLKLFGTPDSQMLDRDTETFSWINGSKPTERKITVSFRDGKVSSFGGDNIGTSKWN